MRGYGNSSAFSRCLLGGHNCVIFSKMKFTETMLSWTGAGVILFLSGLVWFFKQYHGKGHFLEDIHWSGSYVLAISGLTMILLSLLFYFMDKDSAEKE